MADVISFADHRKTPLEKPTVQELIEFVTEEITGHWEKFASNNRLNEYFIQCTPSWSRAKVNYLQDLNALAGIEQKIKLEPQIIAPGFGIDNPLGWVAAFRLNGEVVATPYMLSEPYARCFNILLFLKLGRELQQHGIPIN
jgi:hypothetical protein